VTIVQHVTIVTIVQWAVRWTQPAQKLADALWTTRGN